MLDQMVESRENHGANARRGGFLFTTMILVVSLFGSGVLWSLFAKDLGVGNESLELSTLVAPVPLPKDAPPVPEPVREETSPQQTKATQSVLPTRRENIARVDEAQFVPKETSVVPNVSKSRPNSEFVISKGEEINGIFVNTEGRGDGKSGGGTGTSQNLAPSELLKDTTEVPPVIEKKAPLQPTKVPDKISLGVINGKAQSLPKPIYSAAARAVRASGDVNVQVTIDESGNVISAKAITGHPLLKQAAEDAARSAKFSTTYLSKQPVKVTGLIVYKFALQ